ncbi:universal stress protein [Streptomyces sp. NPDC047928]|uniref:universal stress protein n=1 Tax=unclassified Streptomyces TaxID=2593676 RepID=UPI003715CD11
MADATGQVTGGAPEPDPRGHSARPGEPGELIVGVDPLGSSRPALAWAADEAARRGLALRLVLAVPPLEDMRHAGAPAHREALRRAGARALAEAASSARDAHTGVPVTTELLDGMPAAVLCARSARARLLVVGSRRLGRAAEFFSAGSVAVPVSARADCPVVVVGEPERPAAGAGHLVVGVDGSEASRAALAFALEEAALRGAAVHAVWVWQRATVPFREPPAEGSPALEERRRLLADALAGRPEEYPDVEITHEVVRGHPVEELALASSGALAVVVGRRGRGGYTGMRLGSVVHGLLHRAHCPVITVPVPPASAQAPAADQP